MEPEQELPLWIRVDLGVKAIKVYTHQTSLMSRKGISPSDAV